MAAIVPAELPWTEETVQKDDVAKKDIIAFLQEHASFTFLGERKLKGQLKNVAKVKSKDDAIKFYKELIESQDWRKEGEEDVKKVVPKATVETVTDATAKLEVDETPRFTKKVLKKGNKIDFPKKGDTVKVYYKGSLQNGTVFDTNIHAQRRGKIQPLAFKLGIGMVIRGWDESIKTMSLGEKAEVTIEPVWAYGKQGKDGKIPPNATLIFEMELMAIE